MTGARDLFRTLLYYGLLAATGDFPSVRSLFFPPSPLIPYIREKIEENFSYVFFISRNDRRTSPHPEPPVLFMSRVPNRRICTVPVSIFIIVYRRAVPFVIFAPPVCTYAYNIINTLLWYDIKHIPSAERHLSANYGRREGVTTTSRHTHGSGYVGGFFFFR